ncbi:hypothetical protein AVW16_07395 [Crenobacter luteus]|uniref:GCVT N-terminal domain-containing protein n=2 Tax=Crenobacter luteus TaxID=1452487 RepID=A0A163D553_9NEIS|nr:hypothetical protein AVW16_07395 [Crenobacter luteus]
MDEWQAWCSAHGGHFDAVGRLVFEGHARELQAARDGQTVFSPLTQFALLRVSGADALDFLQGQLSSDLRELNGTNAQYSSYSSAKGRMLASFLVWRQGDDFYLMLSADIADAIQKRLSMFVLRSKVKIERVDREYRLLGVAGEAAIDVLAAIGLIVPSEAMLLSETAGGVAIRQRAGSYLLALPEMTALKSASALLDKAVRPIGNQAWDAFDIAAGIAWVTRPTQEQFVPQMANMDLIGAVSFKKGCYPGQEIVARTQYLGKLKRRLFRATVAAEVAVGDALYSPSVPGQTIGMVANIVRTGEAQMELLVVVQAAAWESGIFVGSPEGVRLSPLTLPYDLPASN